MSLEIPDKPTEIKIHFYKGTTTDEIIKLLNLIDVMSIQNTFEGKILKVILSLRQKEDLSEEAKKILNSISDQGNLVSFISQ